MIIALHGFGLGPGSFADVAAALPRELTAPTIAGHGDQEAKPFDDVVDGIVSLVRAQRRPPLLWGYSLGARLALAAALKTPVAGLVLESGTAGLRDAGERRTRCAIDELRAQDLESLGVDAFFRDWDAQPLFASMSARDDVSARRRGLRAGHDPKRLAAALRALSPGQRPSLHAELHRITAPTLLLVGADDARFIAEARAMSALPASELVVLPGCGHAPHLEDPRAVCTVITAFLQRIPQET
ncbi:MAG: alpha/beta fold hydrolase [Deltaproteobacteria bacterium]|nr:alpha/beta fold hydrolase [Deltaproteobacteria bacterium]